jgi:hypothetical protein
LTKWGAGIAIPQIVSLDYWIAKPDPNFPCVRMDVFLTIGLTMHIFRIQILLIIELLLVTGSSYAFNADGFYSGMTHKQFTAEARNRGLETKEGPNGNWLIGKFSDYRIDGTFFFCGDALMLYNRSVDFDVDYIPTLNSFIEKFGQPRSTRTTINPWYGPGGGDVQSVEMLWFSSNDRITLSFSPEGRDGKGQLRHYRGASISYMLKNRCLKDF